MLRGPTPVHPASVAPKSVKDSSQQADVTEAPGTTTSQLPVDSPSSSIWQDTLPPPGRAHRFTEIRSGECDTSNRSKASAPSAPRTPPTTCSMGTGGLIGVGQPKCVVSIVPLRRPCVSNLPSELRVTVSSPL